MIQIVCCSCAQGKLRGETVDFHSEKSFMIILTKFMLCLAQGILTLRKESDHVLLIFHAIV